MNNLLRTISESSLRAALPEGDLKLLLSSVSDVRSQDAKAADSFYASLESVLVELRTVTPDNRDAEAFLKPVSRTDYPDYYEIIEHPMDLGTMMKHVRARKYKSKQEFAAELNFIWENCFLYNSGPDHVLRGCATRLKRKAEYLLAHVSDRPDRITVNGLPTPSAPPSTTSSRESPYKPPPPRVNGISNGIPTSRTHIPSPMSPPQGGLTPPTPGPSNSKSPRSVSDRSVTKPSPPSIGTSASATIPFGEQPAIIRTPAAMQLFIELDQEMEKVFDDSNQNNDSQLMAFDNKGKGKEVLLEKLQSLAEDEMDVDGVRTVVETNGVEVATGMKRKRSFQSLEQSKRPRTANQFGSASNGNWPTGHLEEELLDSWWEAAQSDALLVGGIPSLPQFEDVHPQTKRKAGKAASLRPMGRIELQPKAKPGKQKKGTKENSKSLLKLMNGNITTLSRIRRTHSKFVALNAAANADPSAPQPPPEPESDHEPDADALMREEGWKVQGEVDQKSADECLNWMTSKVLQHSGFQGTSHIARDVLTSVASEYLQNVGRTIRFLCDKYSGTMSAEEIILHTLFEGGVSEIQDLEKYIKDDVIRYGNRLGDLEKKLVGAYRDITSVDVPGDALFEDAEEIDDFAAGGLADFLGDGEDFLGLRELGIEAEFGLKSLSVPKRLWKGKAAGADRSAADRSKPKEPPLPYPPPPPFVPLEAGKIDSQIGLLKGFYEERFKAVAMAAHPPQPPAPPALPTAPIPSTSTLPPAPVILPTTVLPDDPPPAIRAKLTPLGAVVATNPAAAASKKKGKGKEVAADIKPGDGRDGEPAAKKKETKKKKTKDDVASAAGGAGDSPGNVEVNGTGPKKKPKSSGNKKAVNGSKGMDVPPAIIASA